MDTVLSTTERAPLTRRSFLRTAAAGTAFAAAALTIAAPAGLAKDARIERRTRWSRRRPVARSMPADMPGFGCAAIARI